MNDRAREPRAGVTPFATVVERIESLIAAERADATIDSRCLPILLHHGQPAPRAVVLFHGFTNCPLQFAEFAALLFAAGDAVYVPRLPRHGYRDKQTTVLADLTVDELTGCANEAVDFAAGLGAEVAVLGLSVGATMAAWLAHTRALRRALAVAPFFSMTHVPSAIEPAVAGALLLAPNVELWWDPRRKEAVGPPHGYPRFPTHALARCLEFGQEIRDLARDAAPLTTRTTLVLNAKDPAIDNDAARDVWRSWRDRGAAVDEYVFTTLDERHDIIEPATFPDARTLVYPMLLDLMRA